MTWMILGLLLFLGAHSVRIVADDWRQAQIARFGLKRWKARHALLSLVGFALIVWGYGQARVDASELWVSPHWLRAVAAILTLGAFIVLVAAYVPRNHVKAKVGHPMVVATQAWALAHLLTNARVADLLLFGPFLLWAVLSFRASRARDRAMPTEPAAGTWASTLLTVIVGAVAWLLFAVYLHPWLIGVPAA